MKKLISVVLSVLLLAACFTACAKPNSGDTATTNKPETQQTAAPADNQKPEATEPVEVVLWHTLTDHHQAALDGIIADFNASQDQ